MSNDIIVENTTISQLDEANSITSGDILLVSVPKENTDEFESKKLDYESLKNKLSDDFGISSILDSIAELQRDLSVEPHEIGVEGEGYQILSSIGEDNRGRVDKLNSY